MSAQPERCAPGERVCGRQQYAVCVPAAEKCPITQLSFASTGAADAVELVAGSGLFVYAFRETDNYPLAELTVAQGAGVCLDRRENNRYAGQHTHPLDLNDGCGHVDDQFVALAAQPTLDPVALLQANGVYYDLIAAVPQYKISNALPFRLYQKHYLQIEPLCRSEFQQRLSGDPSEMRTLLTLCAAQQIVCAVFGAFLALCEVVFLQVQRAAKLAKPFRVRWLQLKLLLSLGVLIFVGCTYDHLRRQRTFLAYASAANCLTGSTALLFAQMRDFLADPAQDWILVALTLYVALDWQLWSWLFSCDGEGSADASRETTSKLSQIEVLNDSVIHGLRLPFCDTSPTPPPYHYSHTELQLIAQRKIKLDNFLTGMDSNPN